MTPNDANDATSIVTYVTTASSTAFATSTGVRRGTASSDPRIAPVEYSPVIVMTPSAAIAMDAKVRPASAMDIASNSARSTASAVSHWLSTTLLTSAATPTISTTAVARVAQVLRSVRSLVHSDCRTRMNDTPFAGTGETYGCTAVGAGVVIVLMLRSCRCRRRSRRSWSWRSTRRCRA